MLTKEYLVKRRKERTMYDLVLVELPNPALENPKMYFGLGNLYLSAVAKKAGCKVYVADFRQAIGDLPEALFYGFSATTPQISIAKHMASKVHGKTIIGGPHATLLPADCIGHFDYLVNGEGELALFSILSGTKDPDNIAAVTIDRIIRETRVYNAPRIRNIDWIPYPDWDAVDEPFSKTLYTGERYGIGNISMAMITNRGCPAKCAFCGNTLNNPISFRSIDNIIGEVLELMKRDVHYIRFVDDNFTIHPQFKKLCETLSQYNVHYRAHTRSDFMTDEKAELLALSGCEECSIGVESADDNVLKINKKRELVQDHVKAIKSLKKAGVKVKVYLMSGLPGETQGTIDRGKVFMQATQPDKWTLSTFTPYPGCDIYNNPEKYNIDIVDKNFNHWWNFVFNVRDLELPERNGYVHILKGDTPEAMKARHDEFYNFLIKEELWKRSENLTK